MRTVAMAVLSAIMFLLLTSAMAEAAERYIIVKGDCLSILSWRFGFRGDLKPIAERNNIKWPKYMIKIGQKLVIPDCPKSARKARCAQKKSTAKKICTSPVRKARCAIRVKPVRKTILVHLGRSPLMPYLTPKKMLCYDFKRLGKALELSKEERGELRAKVKNQEWEDAAIESVYVDGQLAVQYEYLTFRRYKRLRKVAPGWKGKRKAYRIPLSCGKIIDFVVRCGNAGLRVPPPAPIPVPKEAPPCVITPPIPTQPSAPPETKIELPPVEVSPPEEEWPPPEITPKEFRLPAPCNELYTGWLTYGNAKGPDADGYLFWAKMRFRLWEVTAKNGFKTCLGIYGFGAFGEGNDQDYRYHWYEYNFGPTIKLINPKHNWDSDADFGAGRVYNKGGIGGYESWQVDKTFNTSLHINEYNRRAKDVQQKGVLFPRNEFNLEYRYPYSSRQHQSSNGVDLQPNPYDNRRLEATVNIGIKDIYWKSSRFTPGFNLGVGHEYGLKQDYYQVGPDVTWALYNQDIVRIGAMNFKDLLGGATSQWHYLFGWISWDGAWRAYKASKIHTASAVEIEKRRLEGSASPKPVNAVLTDSDWPEQEGASDKSAIPAQTPMSDKELGNIRSEKSGKAAQIRTASPEDIANRIRINNIAQPQPVPPVPVVKTTAADVQTRFFGADY